MQKRKWRAFSSALSLLQCGCFIPDLTRLPEAACEGTRQGANSIRTGRKKGKAQKKNFHSMNEHQARQPFHATETAHPHH